MPILMKGDNINTKIALMLLHGAVLS